MKNLVMVETKKSKKRWPWSRTTWEFKIAYDALSGGCVTSTGHKTRQEADDMGLKVAAIWLDKLIEMVRELRDADRVPMPSTDMAAPFNRP